MGAWGTGLFEDDDALDVRDRFLSLVGQGLAPDEASQRLMQEWQESEMQVTSTVFWLALSKVQHDHGRLEERVKEVALAIIDSGDDLKRCEADSPEWRSRTKVLEKLKKQLLSPQGPKRLVKRHCIIATEWVAGDVISYHLRNGKYALIRVLDVYTDQGGSYPIVELLDWFGDAVPSPESIATLLHRVVLSPNDHSSLSQFILVQKRESDLPKDRVAIVCRNTSSKQNPFQYVGYSNLIEWKKIDSFLTEEFGRGTHRS